MSVTPILSRLVALREAVGLTQHQVAERMGTSQSVIARLEGGGRDPRLSTLERYARTVGMALDLRRCGPPQRGTASRLGDRIRARLEGVDEPVSATFREVVQFLDDAMSLSGEELTASMSEEPLSTGDPRWDALVAGAVDWASAVRGVDSPRWTRSNRRQLPGDGWVLTPYTRLHALVRNATPVEFARHGVYVDRASLPGA